MMLPIILLAVAVLIGGLAHRLTVIGSERRKVIAIFAVACLFAAASVITSVVQDNQEDDKCRDMGGQMLWGFCYESEVKFPERLF